MRLFFDDYPSLGFTSICNQPVAGSSPITSSILLIPFFPNRKSCIFIYGVIRVMLFHLDGDSIGWLIILKKAITLFLWFSKLTVSLFRASILIGQESLRLY